LDADDLFLPEKLERQIKHMEAHPTALWSHTSYQRVDILGVPVDVVRAGAFSGNVYPERIISNCPIQTSTVMVRREVLGRLRFVAAQQPAEDIVLWAWLARQCPAFGIDEVLSVYRLRPDSHYGELRTRVSGIISIVTHLVRDNPDFSQPLRRKMLSQKYRQIAYLYLALRDRVRFLWWFGKAVAAWPWNARAYRDFILRAGASLLARVGLLERVRRWRRR
jgi:hypothetical protein